MTVVDTSERGETSLSPACSSKDVFGKMRGKAVYRIEGEA